MPDLSQLSARLGYAFTDISLLQTAMHHRSWNAENDGGESNERLEFLGDAVLGWVVADIVYSQHSDLPEGKLTDLRKSVVNANALAEVAVELGIGEYLMLGKGEDTAGGREKTSILSDALEAVIGAVYIDAGPQTTHDVVSALMGKRIRVHHALAQVGQFSFRQIAVLRVHNVGNYPTKYGVAQKLQAFVAFAAIVFGVPRTVMHGRFKQ